MAPIYYQYQSWLIINEIFWHSTEDSFMSGIPDINTQNVFKNYTCNIIAKSLRGQWVDV